MNTAYWRSFPEDKLLVVQEIRTLALESRRPTSGNCLCQKIKNSITINVRLIFNEKHAQRYKSLKVNGKYPWKILVGKFSVDILQISLLFLTFGEKTTSNTNVNPKQIY